IWDSKKDRGDEEREGSGRENRRQEAIGVVEAVKHERGGNQPHHGEHLLPQPSQQKKDRQDDRQKYEYELTGVEQHGGLLRGRRRASLVVQAGRVLFRARCVNRHMPEPVRYGLFSGLPVIMVATISDRKSVV